MQKKKSISQRSKSKTKTTSNKKRDCFVCASKCVIINFQKALYQKYSKAHFSYLAVIQSCVKSKKQPECLGQGEALQKYYKLGHRRHAFPKIKQIYKLHHQYPKIFMQRIIDILNKCHHRKRLLEYFKIAKVLGIRVDTVKFSTFMISVGKSQQNYKQNQYKFDPLIADISGYEFSEQIEKQLIQSLSINDRNKQNYDTGNLCFGINNNTDAISKNFNNKCKV